MVSSIVKGRVLPPQERRDGILEAAIGLFARCGYTDTDLQVLADELGIGKGTLYRHFGNKERLFLAAVDRVMRHLKEVIDGRIADVEEPLDRIAEAIRAYIEFFDAHPNAVEMLIQERAHFRDRKRPTYFEHREKNIEPWRDLYRDLIAAGHLREFDAARMSDVVGDLCYGTMFVRYIAGRRRPPAQVADDMIDILFHGILSEQQRSASRRRGKANRE